MLPLTKEELKSHEDAKSNICGKRILKKLSKSINYQKVGDHCHYTCKYRRASHSIFNLKFKSFGTGNIGKPDFCDANYSANFKHQ